LDAKAGQNVQLSLHFIPEWKVIGGGAGRVARTVVIIPPPRQCRPASIPAESQTVRHGLVDDGRSRHACVIVVAED
jgi:hypothetical protein